MTTAARTRRAITAEHRSDFDRLVAALPFDPMHPPETGGEDLVMHLARVFALDAVIRAHADGRRVDEAVRDLGALVREAHDELNQQRRTAHLAAARSIADGKVPSVNAKAVATYAAARDRADFLDAMGNLHPILAASKRAAEAMNAEPVTTAALIVTYAAVLGAHESVRRGVRLRPAREGQPMSEAVLRVVAARSGMRSWMHGKGDEDRGYLVQIDHLAREWADAVLTPALRDRIGAP